MNETGKGRLESAKASESRIENRVKQQRHVTCYPLPPVDILTWTSLMNEIVYDTAVHLPSSSHVDV